jgi:hypothetical protein
MQRRYVSRLSRRSRSRARHDSPKRPTADSFSRSLRLSRLGLLFLCLLAQFLDNSQGYTHKQCGELFLVGVHVASYRRWMPEWGRTFAGFDSPAARHPKWGCSVKAETDSREARHQQVVRRFPGGLTPKQFVQVALESADEDGKIDPPSLADWFAGQSILIGMWLSDLIERRCRRDEAGPYFITEKGREFLKTPNSPLPWIARGQSFGGTEPKGLA